ncbi:MAG TPA: hypothetical protein VLU43_16245 [Anaeromyxobacteraceae bacterium]|nr:hypothetical protein [Anaeromyxobacteraceae bacterium]
MSGRNRRARGRGGRIAALLECGDHRAAGEEARRILADPAAPAQVREEAAAALARLRPEPGAALAAALGVAIALAVAAGVLLRP